MDHISNLLTSLRNAESVGHAQLTTPFSKLSVAVLSILQKEGYIASYAVAEEGAKSSITISLLKSTTIPHHYRRISKPGRRLYVSTDKIPTVLRGLGFVILSTPQGVMTGKEARQHKVGGELICEVY